MEAIKPVRVAVIGCGAISGIYFENMTRRFSILEVAACCDLNEKMCIRDSGYRGQCLENVSICHAHD